MANNIKAVKAYQKQLEELKNKELVVGLPTGKADSSVILYGSVHEYGSPENNIPMRSFLRVPTMAKQKEIIRFFDSRAKHLTDGATADEILGQTGVFMQGVVVSSFRNNDWAPLKQSTIDRKGSSAPLIDKRQLSQSITWAVRSANAS